MTKEQIERLHSRKEAIPGKIYTDDKNNQYIGTNDKRLKLIDKSTIVSYKQENTNTISVQQAIDELKTKDIPVAIRITLLAECEPCVI